MLRRAKVIYFLIQILKKIDSYKYSLHMKFKVFQSFFFPFPLLNFSP